MKASRPQKALFVAAMIGAQIVNLLISARVWWTMPAPTWNATFWLALNVVASLGWLLLLFTLGASKPLDKPPGRG